MNSFFIQKQDNTIVLHRTADEHPRVTIAQPPVHSPFGVDDNFDVDVYTVEPTFIRVYKKDFYLLQSSIPVGNIINETLEGFYADVGYIATRGSLLQVVIDEHIRKMDNIKIELNKAVSLKDSLVKVVDDSITEINNLTYANNKLQEEVNKLQEEVNNMRNDYHSNTLINRVKRFLKG